MRARVARSLTGRLPAIAARIRAVFDLDARPDIVDAHLASDPSLRPGVRARPGLRLPGAFDGAELAVRAVLGQQVSVAAARTLAGRLVSRLGEPLPAPNDGLTHAFPRPPAVAGAELGGLGLTGARIATLQRLAREVADGDLVIDPGVPRDVLQARLVALPGIGSWTAGYVAMRAVSDPDVFLPTDLGVRAGLAALGLDAAHAERWRPWRSYALHHLWAAA